MKTISAIIFLACALGCYAAPQFVLSDARVESYRKYATEKQPIAYVDSDSRDVIRILIQKATSPTVPEDICPEVTISEVILETKPVNRPQAFGIDDFISIWKKGAITGAFGSQEISLAPDRGYILLKNGTVIPFDLYGSESIRIWGFMFRKEKQ